jgi:hypothetical protein
MGFRFIALLLAISLAALLGGSAPRAYAVRSATEGSTVVFVVSSSRATPGAATIVPILIIEQGGYKQPVAGDSDAEEISRFASDYYGKGQKYRLLSGGGSAGTLTVKASTKDSECLKTGAEVSLQTQARLNTNVMALATNSDSLGRAQGSRRAPTAAERASVLALAQDTYKQKGVPAALLPSMETVNLTASDLNGDGKAELIGSFVVKKTKGGQERYVLFLLAEPDGNSYKAGLSNYDRFTSKDLMSGANIDVVGQGGVYTERFIDQLDLDRDGTSEVITLRSGLEGDGYSMYRKQKGQWQKLYEFNNYKCAF